MTKTTTTILGLLISFSMFAQFGKHEVDDSIKMMVYWDAFQNINSTTPNFIVFTGIDRTTKESRLICEQGPWMFYKYIDKGRITILDVNKRTFEFESFMLKDTLTYNHHDSTITFEKTFTFDNIDTNLYNELDSLFGSVLISKADEILAIGNQIYHDYKSTLNTDSLNSIIDKNYYIIRTAYDKYGRILPCFYFNNGILTSLDCYDGAFRINKSFKRRASP